MLRAFLSLLLMVQLGTRLPDTSSNGWAVWWPLSLSSHRPDAFDEMPTKRSALFELSETLNFSQPFHTALVTFAERHYRTLLSSLAAKCSSDFHTELMLCVNWMFSMLTSRRKHRKQASCGLIGSIKHKLHGTISKVAEKKLYVNTFVIFWSFSPKDKIRSTKTKIWHSLDSHIGQEIFLVSIFKSD